MFHEVALAVCLGAAVYAITIDVAPPKPHNFQPRVALLKPTGFSVTISDAKYVRQMIVFWSVNKTYDMAAPISTTDDFVAVSNNGSETLTVLNNSTVLEEGSSVYYWIRAAINIVGDDYTEDLTTYGLFNLSFTVAKDNNGELYINDNFDGQTYVYDFQW